MKVKCIKKDIYTECLIVGETYKVIDKNHLTDINNKIIVISYGFNEEISIDDVLKEYFRPLSEIRNEKIDRLLNESKIYM